MFSSRKFMTHEAARTIMKQICGRSVHDAPAVIRVGDPLPSCDLHEDYPTNIIKMPNFVNGKNVVLFGVCGAFFPNCSKTHLPGYVKAADTMKKNGVDEIICVSVNDAYVMSAWAEQQNTKTDVRMFADPTGYFIHSLGLGTNIMPLGGFRSKRFSMVIIDNIVKEINVEPSNIGLSCSLADVLTYKMYLKNKSEET